MDVVCSIIFFQSMIHHFGITVHSYQKDSEKRVAQLVQKLKNEGINPKQWRLDTFQKLLCPKVNCVGLFCNLVH
jgi:hypothetical protein